MHKVYKLILLTSLVLISQMGSAQGNKLSGTMMGSASGVNNGVAKAFDGDPSTYYSSSSASMTWVGLDLGSPKIITQIGFQPPKGSSSK
ncbi:MAG: discoidin domain-containing protein, partial [Bacteroidaceae bacterium]|nr:discoidin domain-containing protein [Bacteroidaceae bacterium]